MVVRGQGYDGAGAMAGSQRGVASRITAQYSCAPYFHCFSHKLNLCVVKINKIPKIQDMFDGCRCISDFFGNSPKRFQFFETILKLNNICRTRLVFYLFYISLLVCYHKIRLILLVKFYKQCQA